MKLTTAVVLFTVLTAAMMTSGCASATTYYVAPNGSDQYTPKQAQNRATPWASVTHASSVAQPGDMVRIASGQYPSQYTVIKATGTKTQPITFVGDTPQPRFTSPNGSTIAIIHGAWIVVRNLDVTSDDRVPNCADGGNGIDISDGSAHITIEHCAVHDCGGGGIGTGNGSSHIGADYVVIKNNLVYNNAWYALYQCSGISLWMNENADPGDSGYHNFITGNICHDNGEYKVTNPASHTDGNGIIIDCGYSHCSQQGGVNSLNASTYVGYNTCYNNGGAGIHNYLNDEVVFDHNTCYHNCNDPNYPQGGECSVVSCVGTKVTGNVLVSSGSKADDCVVIWGDKGTTLFQNNDYFGGTVQGPLAGNMVADPVFESPTTVPPNFDVLRHGPADPISGVIGAWATYKQ